MRGAAMRGLLREPLFHFLVLGGALFGAYAWWGRGAHGKRHETVRIGEADVVWLKDTWARQWQREPSEDELRGLVTEYLREEILAREARAMGLDADDPFVRRRLAQKVDFLVRDTSNMAEPTEADLRAFYAAHPEQFADGSRISFTQVYFREEHRDAVAIALERLRSGADPMSEGDASLLETEQRDVPRQAVAAQFGEGFAAALFALPDGGWTGPIASSYGSHLVRITGRRAIGTGDFKAARERVAAAWRDARQREDGERFLATMLEKYAIVADESVKPLIGPITTTRGTR